MNRRQGIAFAVAAFVFAALVGAMAYNYGVSQGIEESGKIVTAPPPGAAPYPYPYHWHRPFGFFFVPLFIILFWFVLIRGVFWGGGWHRRCAYGGGFDEWHRRAHERMNDGQRVEDDPDRRR